MVVSIHDIVMILPDKQWTETPANRIIHVTGVLSILYSVAPPCGFIAYDGRDIASCKSVKVTIKGRNWKTYLQFGYNY